MQKSLKYAPDDITVDKVKLPKKIYQKKDIMRFNHADSQVEQVKETLYEYIIIDMMKKMLKQNIKKSDWIVGFYTLKK